MNDDPIALLERELLEAARRQAIGGRPRGRPGPGRIGGSLVMAAALTFTLVIMVGALILLAGHHRPGSSAGAVSGRQQLIDILGPLRRPQAPADLHSPVIARLLSTYNPGRAPWDRRGAPDLPLVRRAAITPWGQAVFLVPVKPVGGRGQEGLLVATRNFTGCCGTPAGLETSGDVVTTGQATGRRVGHGQAIERFIAVVPDGVAEVQLGHLLMRVHNNVAAAQANGRLVGPTPVMFWFDAGGEIIRRIGDLAGSYRSIAVSPPGPQTAASRAAERDPSTLNPVSVMPQVGGRHKAFTVHFRVLLNAADYSYTLTGGDCRSLWGTRGSPDDSRGHMWSDAVVPVTGKSWCRGTYHLSVSVNDLGPAGMLKHPAKPFGTATFIVR
jgi:hypothetical protein